MRQLGHLRAVAAATRLQSAWRGVCQRRRYAGQRRALVRLQATVRGRQQRARYAALRRAAVKVQSSRRRTLANRVWYLITSPLCYPRNSRFLITPGCIVFQKTFFSDG